MDRRFGEYKRMSRPTVANECLNSGCTVSYPALLHPYTMKLQDWEIHSTRNELKVVPTKKSSYGSYEQVPMYLTLPYEYSPSG